jgi:hypothetical protein
MDEPADLSSQDRPGWHLLDECVSTRNRKVEGSNPSSGSIPASQWYQARRLLRSGSGAGNLSVYLSPDSRNDLLREWSGRPTVRAAFSGNPSRLWLLLSVVPSEHRSAA